MSNRESKVDEYLGGLEQDARPLAQEIRALIFDVAPTATETFKWGQPCYATSRPFCYFKATKKHITLGFNDGAALDDPDGLLEGTGKDMRHVKIALEGTGVPGGVKDLLSQAASR